MNMVRTKLEGSFNKAKKVISELASSVPFSSNSSSSVEHLTAALVKTIIAKGRQLNSTDVENFRMVWSKTFTPCEVDKVVSFLYNSTDITVIEAIAALQKLSADYNAKLITNLAELMMYSDDPSQTENFLKEIAAGLDIKNEDLQPILEHAKKKSEKRRKLLRSGAGILAALIVLLIFILTATWLQSVIYGLVLAALMFPIEQYFERKFDSKKGLLFHFFNIFANCEKSIKKKLRKKNSYIEPTASEIEKLESDLWTRNAVAMSSIILLAIIAIFCTFVYILSANYMNSAKIAVKNFINSPSVTENTQSATSSETANTAAENSEMSAAGKQNPQNDTKAPSAISNIFAKTHQYLNKNRERFENQPLIKYALTELSELLKNPETQKQVLSMILRKTGNILDIVSGVLSAITVFLLDILLTIFFFLLFLTKMAQFARLNRNTGHNYIVRTLFSGNWLPRTTEEDIQETERIMAEIGHKLKVWLRGYLFLMLIDFTVYTTVFYFLDVPYFVVLGAIAGCGILLPYIGPILSCCLTTIVTLAIGDASTMQIIGIIGIYLLHNGITEQFILYPTVIGESLGLTALETIIVVILGGIFAGASGMIFSIPAAAVIKYLVPRIYHYWQPGQKTQTEQNLTGK